MVSLNFNPPKPAKCIHCRFLKMEHQAGSYACPVGRQTRIGHTQYSKTQVFEEKPKPINLMFRGLTQEHVDFYHRNGKFPPSKVPVFCDWEVMEYEGVSSPEEMEDNYNSKDWLNVTQDPQNAEGYGSILIWVDAALCDRTSSNQYGVVARKDITPKTRGTKWDFVSQASPIKPEMV